MGRLFGTDGVRGVAGTELSCELAMELGRAAAFVLTKHVSHRPKVIIGKDTRISSDMLEGALLAGLCSVGADVEILGVVPTPAVAYLVNRYDADMGVMISASHNPVEYNGIKLFNHEGYKLSDSIEDEIEAIILGEHKPYTLTDGLALGRVSHSQRAVEDYVSHLLGTIPGDLSGLRVAVDCANGSASATAGLLFAKCGAAVTFLHNTPDGGNINLNCGSTHMDSLRAELQKGGYDAGVAYDGDADRCLMLDSQGSLVDGDQVLAIVGQHLQQQGKLPGGALVVTILSNMGLTAFAKEQGMTTVATKVGDRYVLETMLAEGYNIGGEQSGHIIFTDYMTTGDGQLSAIQLMAAMKETGKTLSQLTKVITILPQVLVNMEATVDMKAGLAESLEISAAVRACEEELAGEGRVLIRPSGTEPLIRVMVEGPSQEQITDIAHRIVKAIQETLS